MMKNQTIKIASDNWYSAPRQHNSDSLNNCYLKYQTPNSEEGGKFQLKDGIVRYFPITNCGKIQAVEKERKAKNILLMAIPKEHMRRFHGMDDAKEIWEAIRTRKEEERTIIQHQEAGKQGKNQMGLLTMIEIGENILKLKRQIMHLWLSAQVMSNIYMKKDEKLKRNRRIGMKAVKEKEQLQKTLDSWKDSSKNLWKLIDSGMSSTRKPLYSRFTKSNDFKGVPHPLSGDYTPKLQEEIDDSLTNSNSREGLKLMMLFYVNTDRSRQPSTITRLKHLKSQKEHPLKNMQRLIRSYTKDLPETEPAPFEHTFEEPSPVHQHLSLPQEQAHEQMTMDDLLQVVPQLISRIDSLETDLKQTKLAMGNTLVKLVKQVKKLEGFLKRRNMVLSDSEEEEPEAQGRKSQDDHLASLVQGLVTPSMTKVNASGEEQVEDITPNTLEAAKTITPRNLGHCMTL
ncbi:hypothetical protein Tco_1383524 [Tanacetum coccineum]